MKFNELVSNKLSPFLNKHGFSITEEFKNYVKLVSAVVEVVVSYDERENSNSFYVGFINDNLTLIDNTIIKQVLNAQAELRITPSEMFLDDLINFLKSEGRCILEGNVQKLISIREFEKKRSETYTSMLLNKQIFFAANEAWQNENFREFISQIDKIDKNEVPPSYRLKYKIANQKLKQN
ncbi:MAG TPA: hypothetical protein VF487_20745 [Chitinophagaceae bacterium]